MYSSRCDKCGQYMLINYILTSELLSSELAILINEDGTKNIDGFSNNVIMVCPYCRHTKYSNFDKLVSEFKYEIMNKLLKRRESDSHKRLDKTKLKEENGVSYCGMCEGPFGDGYCYNDLKAQCIVRNKLTKNPNCDA